MSNTFAITQEERAEWRKDHCGEKEWPFNRLISKRMTRLLDSLEQAEAENARLRAEQDWIAGREITIDGFAAPCQCESDYFQGKKAPCGERPDEFCPKFNHRGNGACWVEAARRAVADAESEV